MNELTVVAHIHTDFKTKFGIPRQSGLVEGLIGRIVFTPPYRNVEALRGLDGFSHIWLLWDFSQAHREDGRWSPTVRPPRLGGNRRMGVWATRSPFRPNHIGLSSVRISRIIPDSPQGPVIEVEGADLMDGTPIYDIKPYLPFTDCHPDARGGFAEAQNQSLKPLNVEWQPHSADEMDTATREVVARLLAADPRPHYQHDAQRIYAMEYGEWTIRFCVLADTLTVVACERN